MADALEKWKNRNDVMLVALNSEGKLVAAGWFNLDHNPNSLEKRDSAGFYRESAGFDVQVLRGDDVKKFKTMEWI